MRVLTIYGDMEFIRSKEPQEEFLSIHDEDSGLYERPVKLALETGRPDGLFFHMQDQLWRIQKNGVLIEQSWPRTELAEAEKHWNALT